MDKKKIAAGVSLAVLGILVKKERRDELRYWLEYQANRLGMLKTHFKGHRF